MFLRHLVPSSSVTFPYKFYEDHLKGTAPSEELNTLPNVAILGQSNAISRKRCKIGGKLPVVLITNKRSHMSFRFVPNSVT